MVATSLNQGKEWQENDYEQKDKEAEAERVKADQKIDQQFPKANPFQGQEKEN